MRSPFHRSLLLMACTAAVIGLPGCVNEMTLGKPLPKLDYQHILPVYVATGDVDIVNQFHPTADEDKAASAFPTRPENALNHYAENRLKANGYEGTLQFIIEDASVKHSIQPPDSKVLQFVNIGDQDRYDVAMKVKLVQVNGNGFKPLSAQIRLDRSITVAKTDSIAKRGRIMKDFMQGMIEEIDGMVMSALRDRMHLLSTGDGQPSVSAQSPVGADPAPIPVEAAPSLPVPSVHPQALPPPW